MQRRKGGERNSKATKENVKGSPTKARRYGSTKSLKDHSKGERSRRECKKEGSGKRGVTSGGEKRKNILRLGHGGEKSLRMKKGGILSESDINRTASLFKSDG